VSNDPARTTHLSTGFGALGSDQVVKVKEASMPTVSEQEIRDFVVATTERWNAHDKDGYIRLWQQVAPAGATLEDPVGSPPKHGWDQVSAMWERFNPVCEEERIEQLFVRGNEAAVLMYHRLVNDGEIAEIRDIEIWRFEEGTLLIRCWWDPPDSGAHADSLAVYERTGAQ
jgi:hypothetical protein